MPPAVQSLDHLVLTVADISATCTFYQSAMGMEVLTFHPADGSTRQALRFGIQKINLHQVGQEFDPKAQHPKSGSADLCFLSDSPIGQWQEHLHQLGIPIVEGPVKRSGATGPIVSIYMRDPDGNLIEIANTM
ncbi:MAG: VOC family protein [Pelagimonas sp.]|jgi:catechol 2,3-dioxygenase-like lactoylglutathione lyase family enzyme|nr:VOC family protein [Pelagimonas sp.]